MGPGSSAGGAISPTLPATIAQLATSSCCERRPGSTSPLHRAYAPRVSVAENLFDKSREYEEMLDRGLRLSGESREYFMIGRVEDLRRRLAGDFRPGRILDFGCGIGDTAAYLAQVFPEAEVIGVDTAGNAVAHAREVYRSDRLQFRLVSELEADGSFDLCYTNGVFHHIPPREREAAVRLIHGALAPGGRFALMENNPWNPGTRMVMARIEFDRDAIPLSPPETRRLLRRGGFRETSRPRFLFLFPRFLSPLRFLEPALASLPLGAQYYVVGRKDPVE
jgi:SAM-dependent methyltransferase